MFFIRKYRGNLRVELSLKNKQRGASDQNYDSLLKIRVSMKTGKPILSPNRTG